MKYINIVQALYSNNSCPARAYGELPSQLVTLSTVCHGCPLPPFLFNLVIDMLLEMTLPSSDFSGIVRLPGGSLVDFEYADDVFLFGEDADKMQSPDRLQQ
ncbi:E3 ubiquitin-protein ligase arih2 [Schistosoma haematobium]|uniref:E3 ubiquitin-protein ligase arih2 n=1 Tax=Schistosoma haematobium TaxID=6185 RepID=A0A922IMT1_SCHHA|nr:E3 ubiquitin-protein ligase arih2 [Schistosoma haematobium]KAH9583093.1 E3 ubiquitin-protein ligase arih2 [Schistosoma haematobium]